MGLERNAEPLLVKASVIAADSRARKMPRQVKTFTSAQKRRWERIYEVVRRIPRGRVATYGQVAALAGLPRHARQVGYALHVAARVDQGAVAPRHQRQGRGERALDAGVGPAPARAAAARASGRRRRARRSRSLSVGAERLTNLSVCSPLADAIVARRSACLSGAGVYCTAGSNRCSDSCLARYCHSASRVLSPPAAGERA